MHKDDEKMTIMSENEQLHIQLQELTNDNEELKCEILKYIPECYIYNKSSIFY